MKKQRLRRVRQVGQGHPANKRRSQNLKAAWPESILHLTGIRFSKVSARGGTLLCTAFLKTPMTSRPAEGKGDCVAGWWVR